MLEKKKKKLKNIYFDAHFHWNFANFSKEFCKNSTQNDDFSIYGCSCAHSVEEWNFQIAENLKLQEKSMHKNLCSFGIHPQQVTNESFSAQIDFLQNLISNNKIDAIGEIGFDLGFITNPKNGRVKGLKVVSLDRTYLNSIENISSQVLEQEDYIDQMNEAISDFLMNCYQMNDVSEHNKAKISKLIQITAEIEDLSDECASIIHVLQKYILTSDQKKSSSYEKLLPFVDQVKEFFDYISQHLSFGLSYTLSSEEKRLSVKMEESIDTTKKQLKKLARQRIENGKDVKSELHYIDLVRHIERAGDNVYKIAQTL